MLLLEAIIGIDFLQLCCLTAQQFFKTKKFSTDRLVGFVLMKMKPSIATTAAIVLIVIAASIGLVHGLTYTLDPAEERCFFESIDKPSKLSLKFQVIKGGFLDVDLVYVVILQHVLNS